MSKEYENSHKYHYGHGYESYPVNSDFTSGESKGEGVVSQIEPWGSGVQENRLKKSIRGIVCGVQGQSKDMKDINAKRLPECAEDFFVPGVLDKILPSNRAALIYAADFAIAALCHDAQDKAARRLADREKDPILKLAVPGESIENEIVDGESIVFCVNDPNAIRNVVNELLGVVSASSPEGRVISSPCSGSEEVYETEVLRENLQKARAIIDHSAPVSHIGNGLIDDDVDLRTEEGKLRYVAHKMIRCHMDFNGAIDSLRSRIAHGDAVAARGPQGEHYLLRAQVQQYIDNSVNSLVQLWKNRGSANERKLGMILPTSWNGVIYPNSSITGVSWFLSSVADAAGAILSDDCGYPVVVETEDKSCDHGNGWSRAFVEFTIREY